VWKVGKVESNATHREEEELGGTPDQCKTLSVSPFIAIWLGTV
jgi:hypothetical protein